MTTSPLIPVSEYLSSIYHPDCDYVDGELEERNKGEQPHSALQAIIAGIFRSCKQGWNVRVLTEQRVQISETRFRVPDVCVLRRDDPKDRIVAWAPLLCIEVLSPEDRLSRMRHKVNEFVAFGVRNIWVLDPWERVGYYASSKGFKQPDDGTLRVEGTPIQIVLADIFAELDEL